jgi:cell division protease FtsH
MKKWLLFFLLAATIITGWLSLLNNYQWTAFTNTTNQWTGTDVKEISTTVKTTETDLSDFLAQYSSWTFTKIVQEDGYTLKWYIPTAIPEKPLFGPQATEAFTVLKTKLPPNTTLQDFGISTSGSTTIDVIYNEQSTLANIFLEHILPILFFLLLITLFFKFMWPKWGGFPFGNMKAWILRPQNEMKTKFKDVAGMDEVKDELVEIVDYLKNPWKYQKVWAKIPKWVLLYWPPGAGKTLLARAVAWEAGVPFFSASGSEFMEMLVWLWAAKVRDLFKKAKAGAPSIIFIDEIDTIWRKRGSGHTWWHQEQEQTLNQILTEMDGFDTDTNVIVIAATNRPDILDAALLRSWRFDRKVMVGNPTLEERVMILWYHAQGKKLEKDVDLESLARRTSGFVGADLANILNEAALKVARDNRSAINMDDIDYALEKVVMWPEKKIKSLKEKEKRIVTFHELWHAVTAFYLPEADPVEKISIVSRGMALGVTWMMPSEDTYLYSKAKFLDELVSLLWWRAAEEIFFGKENITTGASNDFEKVTNIAYNMMMRYGMDEELGTLNYTSQQEWFTKPYSEKTAELIDSKVKTIVGNAYAQSVKILTENKELIEKIAELLYDKEYLTREEFLEMMSHPEKIDETIIKYRKSHAKKVAILEKAKLENEAKNLKKSKWKKK